eukprot:scaffold15537_cov170-Amphora_coffeaeformis.AAC.1
MKGPNHRRCWRGKWELRQVRVVPYHSCYDSGRRKRRNSQLGKKGEVTGIGHYETGLSLECPLLPDGENDLLGVADGTDDGVELGVDDGVLEGEALGLSDGAAEGNAEGVLEGEALGLVDGAADGDVEGESLGLADGTAEGELEGAPIGLSDGADEGNAEGVLEGEALGL